MNPVFIVGAPRSGTTWLWGLIKSHPNVVAVRLQDFGIDRESSETGAFINFRSRAKAVIEKVMDDNPGAVIIEKTPGHLRTMPIIKKAFPISGIILVERDWRDVVSSMVNTTFHNFATDVPDAIKKCKSYQRAAARNQHLIDMRIQYEALHTHPRAVMGWIFDQLELELNFDRMTQIIETNKNTVLIDIEGVYRKGQIGSYVDELTEYEIELIEKELCT